MTKKKISMKAMMAKAHVRRAMCGLVGCPAGGWGETKQAMRRIAEELPLKEDRGWTVGDLVSEYMTLDYADRYIWR